MEESFEICTAITTLFEELKKCRLNMKALSEKGKKEAERIASFFSLPEMEAVALVLAVEASYSTDKQTQARLSLLKGEEFQPLVLFSFSRYISSLIGKSYLKKKYGCGKEVCFTLSDSVREALMCNEFHGIREETEEKSIYEVLKEFQRIFETRAITIAEKRNDLYEFEEEVMDMPLVKEIIGMNLDGANRFILYDILGDFISGNKSLLLLTLSDIHHQGTAQEKAMAFIRGDHPLAKKDLVSLIPGDTINDTKIEPSERLKEMALGEDKKLYEKEKSSSLILPESIPSIPLFYPKELGREIGKLEEYLSPSKLQEIQDSLKAKGMKRGFSILFYGLPGTGKTETVYQIAKKTGRSIMKIDISDTKSPWFGESEKRIRDVFKRYEKMTDDARKSGDRIPILLFNEADGVFSRRKDVMRGNVAQTENAIQNIILEGMEEMDGILIATTNLVENFDEAFDRRFLFKLHFTSPTEEARVAIWRSKLPHLDEETLRALSSYSLSGGQIENIARKTVMTEILTATYPTMDDLKSYCQEECIRNNVSDRIIGFHTY